MWYPSQQMSQEKSAKARVMIYYASPKGYTYGYFCSPIKTVRDNWIDARHIEILLRYLICKLALEGTI